MKLIRKICLIIFVVIGCFFIGYAIGKHFESTKMKKIVYVDFISEEIETEQENIHKYKFLPAELSDYIVRMCEELEIDPDLAVAILMQENPEINLDATHRNENGTMDLGLWQLNSYPIDEDCFEKNPLTKKASDLVDIKKLEKQRQKYNKTKDKKDWYELNDAIPSSWLQTRMCHFNYQTLRNIIMWRKNHKLNCWSGKDNSDMEYFLKWAKTLPFADELLFYEGFGSTGIK